MWPQAGYGEHNNPPSQQQFHRTCNAASERWSSTVTTNGNTRWNGCEQQQMPHSFHMPNNAACESWSSSPPPYNNHQQQQRPHANVEQTGGWAAAGMLPDAPVHSHSQGDLRSLESAANNEPEIKKRLSGAQRRKLKRNMQWSKYVGQHSAAGRSLSTPPSHYDNPQQSSCNSPLNVYEQVTPLVAYPVTANGNTRWDTCKQQQTLQANNKHSPSKKPQQFLNNWPQLLKNHIPTPSAEPTWLKKEQYVQPRRFSAADSSSNRPSYAQTTQSQPHALELAANNERSPEYQHMSATSAATTSRAVPFNDAASNKNIKKFVIKDLSHPDGKIIGEKQLLLRSAFNDALAEALLNAHSDDEPIQIKSSHFAKDQYEVNLTSLQSEEKLQQLVESMPQPWSGAKLRLMPLAGSSSKLTKAVFFIHSGALSRSTEDIFKILKKLNENLPTENWRLFKRMDYAEKGSTLFVVGVDDVSRNILQRKPRLYYLASSIKIKLPRDKNCEANVSAESFEEQQHSSPRNDYGDWNEAP